jgi:hypothetical protein
MKAVNWYHSVTQGLAVCWMLDTIGLNITQPAWWVGCVVGNAFLQLIENRLTHK